MKSRAIFSARKFDAHGDWHYFPLSMRIIASVMTRGGVSAWARRYWYER